MRCTEPTEMPMALAIARPVQWVAWCGRTVHVNATTRAVMSAAIGAFAGLAGLLAQQTLDPALGEALLPSPHRRPTDAKALRHLLRRVPIRRGQHDARPLRMFSRPVAVGHDRCQLLALRSAQNHAYLLCHDPIPQIMARYRISRCAGESSEWLITLD
jgi:hypothetical protein